MKLFLAMIAASSIALPAYAGDVKLQVANSLVTLQARDATVREILAEWARVGQVQIINADKVMGVPVTLDLQNVPEAQALDTLLRSVSGYMAAPKPTPVASVSMYDRIVIMAAPRSASTGAATAATFSQQQPQTQQYRMPGGMPNPAMLDDQEDPAGPPPTYPGAPPPYVNRGAPMQQVPPAAGTVPQGAPGTVSPMPQGQPGPPGQMVAPGVVQPGTGPAGAVTPPVVRRPGGPGGPGEGGQPEN